MTPLESNLFWETSILGIYFEMNSYGEKTKDWHPIDKYSNTEEVLNQAKISEDLSKVELILDQTWEKAQADKLGLQKI